MTARDNDGYESAVKLLPNRFVAFDDEFAWRVPMRVSKSQRVVAVRVGSGRYAEVAW
jgi:hypothetical protein